MYNFFADPDGYENKPDITEVRNALRDYYGTAMTNGFPMAVMDLAKKFVSSKKNALSLFFIWGHSFELDKNDSDRWEDMERLCRFLSGKNDIWYATNGEICNYINAIRKFQSSNEPINNTNETLYLKTDKEIILRPNDTIQRHPTDPI